MPPTLIPRSNATLTPVALLLLSMDMLALFSVESNDCPSGYQKSTYTNGTVGFSGASSNRAHLSYSNQEYLCQAVWLSIVWATRTALTLFGGLSKLGCGKTPLRKATTMSAESRVHHADVPGAEELFTPDFLEFIVAACDKFKPAIEVIRQKRAALIERAIRDRVLPTFPPESEANSGDWRVPELPEELTRPGIEISGPVSITNMAINALNPGSDGERATGYLDDDEDSGGHRLQDTVQAAINRRDATLGTITFHNPMRNRTYELMPGALPFFMHRERATHLDEPDFTVDGDPIPATILGMGLTLAYGGKAQVEQGQGVYFYLPKVEVVEEARFYRDFFDFGRERLGLPGRRRHPRHLPRRVAASRLYHG